MTCATHLKALLRVNAFIGDVVFDEELGEFTFFRVSSLSPTKDRYRQLGQVVSYFQRAYKIPFSTYTPSEKENYVIGAAPLDEIPPFKVEYMVVEYAGVNPLPPIPPAFRTLTELLNKIKGWELSDRMWSVGRHRFFFRRPKDLERRYPGCGLLMFRGPYFRYNITHDGRILLFLDSTTHYIRKESILDEARARKLDLVAWLSEEIKRREELMKRIRRRFRGLHFFYELARCGVNIVGVDPRPIAEIPLSGEVVVGGRTCRTIAEFLRAKYPKETQNLDETQPGLKGHGRTFAPQFLHRTVSLDEVPDEILNEQTYHIDTKAKDKEKRDIHRPAKVRWDIIKKYHRRFFRRITVGTLTISFEGLLDEITPTKFEKPPLMVRNERDIAFSDVINVIKKRGFHKGPCIRRMLLYSCLKTKETKAFYRKLRKVARGFHINLPEGFLPLEEDLSKAREQIRKIPSTERARSFCLGLIPERSELHDELTNICGELKIPSKCISITTVRAILAGRLPVSPIVLSIACRANGIPWLLGKPLYYDCYVAVDVGRSKAEWWAMSVVYNKHGEYRVTPGKLMVGESLDEQSIRQCIENARSFSPWAQSIIFLRHGNVSKVEEKAFVKAANKQGFNIYAAVSIKQRVPHRIFRREGQAIRKPLSGDYYVLDEYSGLLCGAGADEYEHGMPKPILVELVPSSIKGDINITYVLRDVFYLTYLSWPSPSKSYSIPAPLRLAHKLAYELAKGVKRHGAPF